MISKSKMIARIRALLLKTVENGATEAEALAAAEKARALMDEHQIDITAQDIDQEPVDIRVSEIFGGRMDNSLVGIAEPVGIYCDVTVYSSGPNVNFVGIGLDAQVAHYMFEMLVNTCRSDWAHYQKTIDFRWEKSCGKTTIGMNTDFKQAFCHSVREKIFDEIEGRKRSNAPQIAAANALVPIKDEAVTRELANRGIRLKRKSYTPASGAGAKTAREAGSEAGAKAQLNRSGVGQGGNASGLLK